MHFGTCTYMLEAYLKQFIMAEQLSASHQVSNKLDISAGKMWTYQIMQEFLQK